MLKAVLDERRRSQKWDKEEASRIPFKPTGERRPYDAVVTSIAGMAAREFSGAELEVPGTRLPGDTSPIVGEFFGGLAGSARGTRGVFVEVGASQAAVDLTVTVPYGRSIPEITKAMRENVIGRVQNLTGLEVVVQPLPGQELEDVLDHGLAGDRGHGFWDLSRQGEQPSPLPGREYHRFHVLTSFLSLFRPRSAREALRHLELDPRRRLRVRDEERLGL